MVYKNKKLKIAIVTGGWSCEREVSLGSAENVRATLEKTNKYDLCTIVYEKDLYKFTKDLKEINPDVALLAIHGEGAEDGVLQAVLDLSNVPYTHSSVIASAICMDKSLSRGIFKSAGILVPKDKLFTENELGKITPQNLEEIEKKIEKDFNYPFVVKPRNEGSSVGVYIVKEYSDFKKALLEWKEGKDLLIEEYLSGKEVTIGIINGKAFGSLEVITKAEFLDYKSKYTHGESQHITPADISPKQQEELFDISERAYAAIECRGLVRADFICTPDSKNYLLELNTIPGMTRTSFIPDMAESSNIPFAQLLEMMIEDALKKSKVL